MQSKIFNIKLNVVTPVHIGDGSSYNPTDYAIEGNELHIIDQDRFIQKINSDTTLYNDFLARVKNFTVESIGLVDFIREQSKGLYKYAVKLDNQASEYVKKFPDEIGRAPIDKFIRNPYDDTVYIPGSSIKGALRSAIIEVILKKLVPKESDVCSDSKSRQDLLEALVAAVPTEPDNNKRQEEKSNQKRKLPPEILFKFNAAQIDLLKYVSVSDFYPVKVILQVCKPINKNQSKENVIPALLECAMPDSIFEGTIKIQKEFFDKLNFILKAIYKKASNQVDLKSLDKDYSINEFNHLKLAAWFRVNFINSVYKCEKLKSDFKITQYNKDNLFLMKIGKHGGALSKTTAGLRKIQVNAFNPESFKKEKNILSSQTTFWYIDNKPMGWVAGEVSLPQSV